MSLKIILFLLAIGNVYAIITLHTKPQLFLEKYPKLSINALRFINILPLFSLAGYCRHLVLADMGRLALTSCLANYSGG